MSSSPFILRFRSKEPWRGPEYLGKPAFLATIAAAFLLHVLGIALWQMMPRPQVIDITVHALNIKLSDGEPIAPETPPARNDAVEAMEKQIKAPSPIDAVAVQEQARSLAQTARRFFRANAEKAKIEGNKRKAAEIRKRYEQLIGLRVLSFQLPPEELKAAGMEGETVVRIRIDRQGNVHYYALEYSTGHEALDRAALDMVRRANPVPAVPDGYPADDLIEFLIPVSFTLKNKEEHP